jgi:lipoyl(octanoyl) transferase
MEKIDSTIIVRHWPVSNYQPVWEAMRAFTDARTIETPDELWVVQHTPVFTQGQAGRPEHILNARDIPVVQTDRGGQVTYHGPGQLVVYTLLDLQRRNLSVHQLVFQLEQVIIELLGSWGIIAHRKLKAPGVYVDGAKIAAIGLRLRRQCSYHGFSLNVDMDLSPFNDINPCGYLNQTVTQIKYLKPDCIFSMIVDDCLAAIQKQLAQCTTKAKAENMPVSNQII